MVTGISDLLPACHIYLVISYSHFKQYLLVRKDALYMPPPIWCRSSIVLWRMNIALFLSGFRLPKVLCCRSESAKVRCLHPFFLSVTVLQYVKNTDTTL